MGLIFLLLETIAKVEAFKANLRIANEGILTEWCVVVRGRARAAIGTYKYGWPPLGPEAIAKHGDTPLLDTGALRDSISAFVEMSGPESGRGVVGSDNEIAVYQELGTSHIPPRSFLMESAVRSEKDVIRIAKKFVASAWASAKHGEILALLHAIKIALEIAHEVYRVITRDVPKNKYE
jgi:hypothetical protein